MDGRGDNMEDAKKTEDINSGYKTFLELMIEYSKADGETYSHKELREETAVLAMTGSNTSTVGISFVMLLLAHHQDIQEKVYKEIQEVLEDPEKPLQAKDLMNLKYTVAVIKETLRLFPPLPFIMRHCKKPVELPSGLVLPSDCDAIISIWGIHRNPEHWGEDVNEFKPDRFMNGPTPNAFFAFSHGARNCVGQQYAILFMTTLLVTTMRRYRFIPATNSENSENKSLRVSLDLILKDVNNFLIRLEYRNT